MIHAKKSDPPLMPAKTATDEIKDEPDEKLSSASAEPGGKGGKTRSK